MSSGLSMRGDNKGLTVRVNFWALEKYLDNFNSEMSRLWIKGEVTNAETKKAKKFNDAGELITILGKWNVDKFKQLRKRAHKGGKK
jgi:DNA transposition AAA+ family ATPase